MSMKSWFLSAAAAVLAVSAHAEVAVMKAWLDVREVDGQLEFKSMAQTAEPSQLTYRLTVERISDSGRSSTSQGGNVVSEDSKAVVLSTVRVNRLDSGTVRAVLKVTTPDGQFAEDTIDWKAS